MAGSIAPARPGRWRVSAARAPTACDNPAAMNLDDRFHDLVTSLGGFYSAWVIHLGLELGLFSALRRAAAPGLTPVELAAVTGMAPVPVARWCRAAFASDLIDDDGTRVSLDEVTAAILLDVDRPEYLGGQFAYTVTASLDYDAMADYIRTERLLASRPPRYYRAFEQLTRQDIAVFFEEALAALPDLVTMLARGAEVIDLHCGGGRWLVAVARRFPATRLVGVESEPDSTARAMRLVQEAGLEERIRIEAREVASITHEAAFDLAYFQHALHQIPEPAAALAAAWRALRPGGRLLILGWCLPANREDLATLHGQLISGVALDESLHGGRLRTVEEHAALFEEAGLPVPRAISLPSDATLLVAQRPA
jgi:SAM-dependent methyltransferase